MLSSELRDRIQEFISATITIAQLEDWLVPRMPYFLRFPNTSDADVVSAVELGLAEIAHGIRSKEEIRKYLEQVLQEYNAVSASYLQDPGVHIESVSANTTSRSTYLFPSSQVVMTVV